MKKVCGKMLTFDAATDNPLFQWEKGTNRYRNKTTGRFISKEAVYTLTQKRIENVKQDLGQIAQLLLDNKITLRSWQEQTAEVLKILHTQEYLLGVGGQKALKKSDYLEIGRELKNQYDYLRNFAVELTQGTITRAQFKARVDLYAEAAKVSFFRGEKVAAIRVGYTHAKRLLGIAEHCSQCPQYAARGIVLIDEVIFPTQACDCGTRCHCRLQFLTLEEAIAGS
ncbi:hypothetical protein WA1_19070 [Scytonema hofmannii PCC 7110]|uniref:Phage head morphogenesis domain-containing protein n=1 Tax=Scytonema hofmannii PCC 7110 TaxID=128403 RepID=A0A139XBS8_9CYAN|nr:hypothetical protein [Scytonema hofmannii]KYC42103.1 hypothetical protein WA1_19070 [Scytonema hofmannii PCC 7110]